MQRDCNSTHYQLSIHYHLMIALLSIVWFAHLATDVQAEVTRLEIRSKEPFAMGLPIGQRGSFETWKGVAHFALDPTLESNRGIVDLSLAPCNSHGKVEFQADVAITRPVDLGQSNGVIFYDVNNRGNPTAPRIIDGDADHFLLRQGFIFVTSGWIAEVHPGDGRLTMVAPEPMDSGVPLRGLVRNEIVVDAPTKRTSVSDRPNMGSYRPSQRSIGQATLSVRERESDARQLMPREHWKLVVTDQLPGGLKPQLPLVELEVENGLKPGWIYEIIYEAEGSIVQGVGMAGIRDLISFLKFDRSTNNPLRKSDGELAAAHAIGFGTSQSGRLLRQFVYEGFNVDEQGRTNRRVFDGVIPHVAGGALGSFNHRFASPTRTNGQHDEHLFPADYFPFAYGDEHDPYQNRSDAILRRSRPPESHPAVFHTQSSSEYWHRSGSLVHTDPLGTKDSEVPPNVRIFAFGGTQHGAGNGIPTGRGNGQLVSNPADYKPLMRALVMAMAAWVRDGVVPPTSVYPRIDSGTLVGWPAAQSGWPTIPGANYPAVVEQPHFLDRGSDWLTRGIATIEPPIVKEAYKVRVPAYGPDGNERGTLLLPAVEVPVATYTSWNTRGQRIGAEGELLGLEGGYIPLARTGKERQATGDPRPALLERYRDFNDYQAKYMAAAQRLVTERLLLAEDLPRLRALSEKHRPLFEQETTTTAISSSSPPFYDDKFKLLQWIDSQGQSQAISSSDDWKRRREHIVAGMELVMGSLPESSKKTPLDVQVLNSEELPTLIRKKITYQAGPGDRIPAYLLIPKKLEGRAPAMLCLHGTSGSRGRTAGLGADYPRYTLELAERGYVTIAPDYTLLGDNQTDPASLGYASGTMKGVWSHIRAVDLLESLPEVDRERIGCIGVSLGGHNSLFAGVFDPRLKVIVTSSGFDSFLDYMDGNPTGWCQSRYMPRIETVYRKEPKKLPFDFPEVLAAIAPRPLYVHAPQSDSNFKLTSVKRCEAAARDVYQLFNANAQFVAVYPPGSHGFPVEARQEAYDFVDRAFGIKR